MANVNKNVLMTDTGGWNGYVKPATKKDVVANAVTAQQNAKAATPASGQDTTKAAKSISTQSASPASGSSYSGGGDYYSPEEYYAPAASLPASKYGDLSYDPVSSQAYTDAMARLSQMTGGLPAYTDQYADQIVAAMGARPVYDDQWTSRIDAAMADKPADYVDPFEGQLNALYDQIVGRGKFNYDVNGDALYQQYKDLYTTQGQMAMQDTMGQAAALTGGYGSTYSQNAGQQAYNSYLQQLGAIVPDLEARAFSEWQAEGQDLQNQYAMLQDRSDTAYGRYRDDVSDYYNNLSVLQNRASEDYGRYRDSVSDWQTDLSNLQRQSDTAYGRYQDQLADYYNQYGLALDEANTAYSRQKDERSRLLDLIGIGYTPSEAELAAAGMSTGEAQAYIDYYNSMLTPAYSGGGGGSGGSSGSSKSSTSKTDDSAGVPFKTSRAVGTGTDKQIAQDTKSINSASNKSLAYGALATTVQSMAGYTDPQDISDLIFSAYYSDNPDKKINEKEAQYLYNRYVRSQGGKHG